MYSKSVPFKGSRVSGYAVGIHVLFYLLCPLYTLGELQLKHSHQSYVTLPILLTATKCDDSLFCELPK